MHPILHYTYRIPRYFTRMVKEAIYTRLWNYEATSFIRKHKSRLLKLKDVHKGEPCVLIGGGPSINKQDLNQLKDYVTIACNGFYLKHSQIDFIPTYYTVEDPLPAKDNFHEISSLRGTTKIMPYDLSKIMTEDENTIYVNFRRSYLPHTSGKFPYFSEDFANQCYWGGTVMYFNIQLAHYLGCSPIYLIGVDLSYRIPEGTRRSGAVLTSTSEDVNHFDPRYFGEGKKWHLPEVDRMQKAFDVANESLDRLGVELFNAGVGGKLKNIKRKFLINSV